MCGGSGAGKTYLVRQVQSRCAAIGMRVAHVSFDAYYHDLQHLTPAERSAMNFDHPDSLDGELFAVHVSRLATGEPIEVPLYDFSTHARTADTTVVGPADIVVLDGILLYAFESVRAGIDLSVYLDVPAGLRLDRRVARDTVERGATSPTSSVSGRSSSSRCTRSSSSPSRPRPTSSCATARIATSFSIT